LPQEFPDWRSCVEDRDATIYKLSADVVNLCQVVEYKNTAVRKRSAPVHDWFNPSIAHQDNRSSLAVSSGLVEFRELAGNSRNTPEPPELPLARYWRERAEQNAVLLRWAAQIVDLDEP
jgi:hypothetical protein